MRIFLQSGRFENFKGGDLKSKTGPTGAVLLQERADREEKRKGKK
jgi:hypothetical protein